MTFECPICLDEVFETSKFETCEHKVCNECYTLLRLHGKFECPFRCGLSMVDDISGINISNTNNMIELVPSPLTRAHIDEIRRPRRARRTANRQNAFLIEGNQVYVVDDSDDDDCKNGVACWNVMCACSIIILTYLYCTV